MTQLIKTANQLSEMAGWYVMSVDDELKKCLVNWSKNYIKSMMDTDELNGYSLIDFVPNVHRGETFESKLEKVLNSIS